MHPTMRSRSGVTGDAPAGGTENRRQGVMESQVVSFEFVLSQARVLARVLCSVRVVGSRVLEQVDDGKRFARPPMLPDDDRTLAQVSPEFGQVTTPPLTELSAQEPVEQNLVNPKEPARD
jgi:hypothetical protein